MKKKILLISQGAAFMVGTINKNFKDAGYEVVPVLPKLDDIDAHQGEAELFVFYLGDFVSDIAETLVFLNDLCTERDKLLILIGNPAELSVVEQYIPQAVAAAIFERPLDVKSLIAETERLIEANDDSARRKSILLVDDDVTFLKMMKGWLSMSYRVTIVTSGAQALMYVADNRPDLILLDYEMPVTSGAQVLEMLRAEKKIAGIPVIFLTGKDDRDSVLKLLALKPDGYLLKTLPREEILNTASFMAAREPQSGRQKSDCILFAIAFLFIVRSVPFFVFVIALRPWIVVYYCLAFGLVGHDRRAVLVNQINRLQGQFSIYDAEGISFQ